MKESLNEKHIRKDHQHKSPSRGINFKDGELRQNDNAH